MAHQVPHQDQQAQHTHEEDEVHEPEVWVQDPEAGVWVIPEQGQRQTDKYWDTPEGQETISKAITVILRYNFQDNAYIRGDVLYQKLKHKPHYDQFKLVLQLYHDRYIYYRQQQWGYEKQDWNYKMWYELKPKEERLYRHGLPETEHQRQVRHDRRQARHQRAP